MIDYFLGRRSWHEFHEFLHMLPSHRKFKSALMLDEEYAGYVQTQREKERERQEAELEAFEEEEVESWRRPTLRSQEDYTPELAALHILDEHIQVLVKYFVAANSAKGQKGPEVQRHPRPYTMVDAIDLETEREEMHDLARQVGLR